MAVKRLGILGGTVTKINALTVKMEMITAIGKGGLSLICFV
jgi:hypothetical protein